MSQKKIDRLIWFIVWMLPVFFYGISLINGTIEVSSFSSYMRINGWSFGYIYDLINSVFATVLGGVNTALSHLVSYWVMVEIMHVFFDVIVFIPRFSHALIDKFTKEDVIK